MKRLSLLILVVVAIAGCSSVPQELRAFAVEACETYNDLRPDVVELRGYVIDHLDQIPVKYHDELANIDEKLAELDRYGKLSCALAQGAETKFSAADAGAVLLDLARLTLEMKEAGVL